MSVVHVFPHRDGWAVEVAGDKRESFDTWDKAIRRGCELAEQEQGELVIHGRGRIEAGRPVARKSWFHPSLEGHGHDPRDLPG
jgi:Uncharacterized protein conserved in bacteria (DUF2188)